MFIELIVVCAIVMYLYSAQILSFSSPYGVIISVGIVITAISIGWAVTHYIARRFVDNLFGFGDWSPRGPKRTTPQEQMRAVAISRRDITALEQLTREVPMDVDLSKRLSDEYFRQGMTDKFIAERLRAIGTNQLTLEESCSIYNRLADVEVSQGRRAQAISHLRCIIEKYPQAVEARHAEKRIAVLDSEEDSGRTMESEA